MPGQTFSVCVSAIDRLSQRAPTVITSTILSDQNVSSQIGTSGYYSIKKGTTTNVPLKILGQEHEEINVGLYSIESFADTQFSVTLLECVPGFTYSSKSATCTCRQELAKWGIACDTENAQLSIPSHLWIGPIHKKYRGEVDVVEECVLDYCQPGAKTIVSPHYDSQCNEGYSRTGILCGTCKDGYSVAFGTNKCLRCTNTYLLLLIVFMVAGILLALSISLLHITVTRGYLNAVLLYCNVTGVYLSTFTLKESGSSHFLLISFLNLNLGIEVCFFDGMNALTRVSLQLLFPAYLFLLMGILILLARTKCFRWLAHPQLNAVKVFGTLLILCYSSVLGSCIEILGVVHMHTLSGEHMARWVMDPTVPYFQGWHGLLGAIAVLLVVLYISLFPLLLLSPTWAYRLPYIKKMKPLFDALYHPFTKKVRWWLGVRLILRSLPLTFAFFTQFPLNLFLLAMFLVALLYLQLVIRPFEADAVNAVDNFLIANAIFLTLGALYFGVDVSGSDDDQSAAKGFFYSLVYIAYIVFTGVFIYYVFVRLPDHQQQAIKNRISSCRNKPKRGTSSVSHHKDDNLASVVTHSSVSFSTRTNFELRAPLMD